MFSAKRTLLVLVTILVFTTAAYAASITSDVSRLSKQLRLNHRFNMISSVSARGRFININPENQRGAIFVAVNSLWHKLSQSKKQQTADAVLSRWKAICAKSGRHVWIIFQQKPRYDLLAQCDLDMGCEIINDYKPPLPYQNYGGKYPYEIAKFDSSINRKLQKLLGNSYTLYRQNSVVQTRCITLEGYLVLYGWRAKKAASDYSFVLIDLPTGTMYVGIISDANTREETTRVFSEGNKPLPSLFRRILANGPTS